MDYKKLSETVADENKKTLLEVDSDEVDKLLNEIAGAKKKSRCSVWVG